MGYHLHAKDKAGANNRHDGLVSSLAPALYALALNVQDYFVFAASAVYRKACGLGFTGDAEKLFVLPANGADRISISYFNYTTTVFRLQQKFTPFV